MALITLHNLSPLIEASDLWAVDPATPCWLSYEGNTGRIRLSRAVPAAGSYFADVQLVDTLGEPVPDLPVTTVFVEWPSGRHMLHTPPSWDLAAPYEGRPYALGKFDCYMLVRDWMSRERGIDMSYLTENPDRLINEWLTDGAFETNPELHKWDRVINPQAGDGILFSMNQTGPARANHAAVYLGDGKFLHHYPNRASVISDLDSTWRPRVAAYMRYNG